MVPVAPLLATIIAVAGLTSAVWWGFWKFNSGEQIAENRQIAERLERIDTERARLLEQYSATEQARLDSERRRLTAEKELAVLRRQLDQLEAENWPERYRRLEQENYDLSERLQELEVQYSIQRDNLATDIEDLQADRERLQQDYAELEREHLALGDRLRHQRESAASRRGELQQALDEAERQRRQLARLRGALERDLIARELDGEQLRAELAGAQTRVAGLARERDALKTALAESEQHLQALQERNRKLTGDLAAARDQSQPPPVQPMTSEAPPRAVPAVAEGETESGFRVTRLKSLKAALNGASSADRKAIILSVIPSIPGGVKGTELADLVAGMDSRHVVEVIAGSREHIRRPVDNASHERIMQLLENEASRRQVARLLQ